MVRVIIAGSREFTNYNLLKERLNQIFYSLHEDGLNVRINNLEVICGMARGTDLLGKKFADEYGIKVKEMPANWNEFGKSAGYIRNTAMARYANEAEYGILIAFWDNVSRGTKNMIEIASKQNLKIFIEQI